MRSSLRIDIAAAAVAMTLATACAWPAVDRWSEEEVEAIADLWIGHLETLPADPTNRVADVVASRVRAASEGGWLSAAHQT